MIDELQRVIAKKPKEKTRGFAAFRTHLLDVANLQVRNIGSIGGNVMMTRAQAETDSPFPSDVYLVLETLGASITIASRDYDGGSKTFAMAELPAVSKLPADAIAQSFHIPYSQAGDEIETFKIAYRDQNAHAIVNAGFIVRLDKKDVVQSATILYGGLAAMPSRMTKTEKAIVGAKWTDATLQKALDVLGRRSRGRHPSDAGHELSARGVSRVARRKRCSTNSFCTSPTSASRKKCSRRIAPAARCTCARFPAARRR